METTFRFKLTGLILICVLSLSLASCNQEGDEVPNPTSVTDADGNTYPAVTIGTQVWMAENLKVTRFNNGIPIPNITDNSDWSQMQTPAYSMHNNDEAKAAIYGMYYNGYAVETGNLCPQGWHVPSQDEWNVLFDYLGGRALAGDKLKETGSLQDQTGYWYGLNTGATNEVGFSARGGAERLYTGLFMTIGVSAYFWTTTPSGQDKLYSYALGNSAQGIVTSYNYRRSGLSCRCLLD